MITQDDEDIIVNRLPIPPWQYRRGPPSSNSPSSSRQDLDSDVLPSYAAAVAAPTTLNTRLNPAVHAATTDRPPTYDSSTSSPSHTNQHPTTIEASNHSRVYYVVRIGRISGVFNSWREVDKHVTGFPGAEYESYATKEEAVADWQEFRADFEAFRIARRAARLIRINLAKSLGFGLKEAQSIVHEFFCDSDVDTILKHRGLKRSGDTIAIRMQSVKWEWKVSVAELVQNTQFICS
ncbi:hypothetical protein P692DRAFT_20924614 [Suillus brevipes Sb2]|nr:hypothetical protein P692DRAFT_20924614 [Suillus brevipes Sb2]